MTQLLPAVARCCPVDEHPDVLAAVHPGHADCPGLPAVLESDVTGRPSSATAAA